MADAAGLFESFLQGDPAMTGPREESPGEGASDTSLLQRFRGGDEGAAAELYLRYADRLRGLIRARCSAQLAARLDADDIVQSVFRSFFRAANAGVYSVPPGKTSGSCC